MLNRLLLLLLSRQLIQTLNRNFWKAVPGIMNEFWNKKSIVIYSALTRILDPEFYEFISHVLPLLAYKYRLINEPYCPSIWVWKWRKQHHFAHRIKTKWVKYRTKEQVLCKCLVVWQLKHGTKWHLTNILLLLRLVFVYISFWWLQIYIRPDTLLDFSKVNILLHLFWAFLSLSYFSQI